MSEHITGAFSAIRAAAESLRNAEFHLGLLPEKPRSLDDEAVRTHLADVRIALGSAALKLSEEHASEPVTDDQVEAAARAIFEEWQELDQDNSWDDPLPDDWRGAWLYVARAALEAAREA